MGKQVNYPFHFSPTGRRCVGVKTCPKISLTFCITVTKLYLSERLPAHKWGLSLLNASFMCHE